MTHTCKHCGVTFIGPRAVIEWSDHTWVHWPEIADEVS